MCDKNSFPKTINTIASYGHRGHMNIVNGTDKKIIQNY